MVDYTPQGDQFGPLNGQISAAVFMLESGAVGFTSHSPEQTAFWGFRLGELLTPGDVICLSGDLGAGKTVFAKGIGKGWGALEPVTSPTFTLIHEHRRPRDSAVLYHVDCYRLHSSDDAWGIGLDELLRGGGVLVIEWPEHIHGVLPGERLWITLELVDDTQRHLRVEAIGERYGVLLETLRHQVAAG